jgi:CheY-like chemotaxis protein
MEKRKKSIIGVSRAKRRRGRRCVINILHVEDYKLVAQAVRDILEAVGWKVETCADGAEAMKILTGDEPYNILIFDYDLPGHNGIELTRYTRTLPTDGELPSSCSQPATSNRTPGAGASAVLRKPDEVGRLSETVTRLLSKDTTGRQ